MTCIHPNPPRTARWADWLRRTAGRLAMPRWPRLRELVLAVLACVLCVGLVTAMTSAVIG